VIATRHFWAGLALLACSSYSYSDSNETVYGTTNNAADFGLQWVMNNILPQQAGLSVSTVIYRYTTVKDEDANMLVHVQNENAQGPGYIFRSTDDWSGIPGSTINKAVAVENIPRELWGLGSIEVEGEGNVEDPFVAYAYKYEPCFDPQAGGPTCPGWKDPTIPQDGEPEAYDPMDDDLVQAELNRKAMMDNEDEEERQRQKLVDEDEGEDERLEKLLGTENGTAIAGASQLAYAGLQALDFVPQSYLVALPSTQYEEKIELKDGKLPDNARARRVNFAQDAMHNDLVNLQYKSKK
jgi:hypothetical protein